MGLVDRSLSNLARKLGYTVALYPKYFLITSVVLALTLGTGLLQMTYDDDVNRLYLNTRGRSVYEKATIQKYFVGNYSGAFDFARTTEFGRFIRLIVTAKDGGSMLRTKIWKEIGELDDLLHSIQISDDNKSYNYSHVCAQPRDDGQCFENQFLDLGEVMDQVENGSLRMSYPVMINPDTFNSHVLVSFLSGLQLSNDNLTLVSAEALGMVYFLNVETPEDMKLADLWEEAASHALLRAASQWNDIKVYHLSYYSIVSEQEKNTWQVLPYFTITLTLMCLFAILTAMSRDWVKAKPYVAMFGILAALLGSLAGFGFLCYIGVPLIGINLSVPFIMLGIGIDDSFVMLSAWRQTCLQDSVPKRLADTYAEAAVSITITTLTDMFSFYVGLLTPIPSVQIFCTYAGTCILWIYFYQIFCFGAILGVSGDQEAGNRHSVFWWIQATPKSKADGKSTLFKIFFTGGIDKADPTNRLDNSENAVMVFFRDHYSGFIAQKWVRFLVFLVFLAYLGISGYGLMGLTEGLKEERLFHEDSYLAHFYATDYKYFKGYQYRTQIAITTPMDYSKQSTQARVEEILDSLRNSSKYVSPDFGENWLTSFTSYVDSYAEYFDFNITTEQQFIDTLRNEFFLNNIYSSDVAFNEEGTKIIASRFIIQLVETWGTEEAKEAYVKLREAAANITDVEVVPFQPWLSFVDQFIIIRPLTIQLLSIAAAIVMVIAIIFIPNFITALCVFFTIVSTEFGVMGLMALWGVSLDIISIMCLIMCIGFSVDFSAHVCYAYISSPGTPEERIQKAMYSLGLPILQGGGSTIIGVFSLVFIRSYISQVFFKVVFLVITCAAFHGLFVLPVLLPIIKPETFCNFMSKSKEFDLEHARSNQTEKNHES